MDREKLKEELRRDEGLRLEVYLCSAGHRTIGYGHLIDKLPFVVVCNVDEAERWLDLDIDRAIQVANAYIWPRMVRDLTEVRQRALINMAFNMGTRLVKFIKMRKAIHKKEWQEVKAEALDSLWARQVGDRAKRIAEMWEKG